VKAEYNDESLKSQNGDYYFISPGGGLKFSKFVGKDGSYTLLRCDERDASGGCFVKTVKANGQPSCSYVLDTEDYATPPDYFGSYKHTALLYDDEKYPVFVDCPDGQTDCRKYCDANDEEKCLTIDDACHIVQNDKGNFTIYEDTFSMDIFKDTMCDSQTEIPAPPNLCETTKIITSELPCSYHVKVENEDAVTEYYGVKLGEDLLLAKVNTTNTGALSQSTVYLVRCDIEREEIYCKTYVSDGTSCSSSFEHPSDFAPQE